MRQFIGTVLGRLAQDIQGAVLVNAHPSRSGLSAGGSMDSGSTGWNNSARSRWALTRPEPSGGQEVDPAERLLTRRKANYAGIGTNIRLRWQNGVLVPLDRPGGMLGARVARAECENVFIELLAHCTASNMPVSNSPNAGNYAPRVFSARPDRCGYGKSEFAQALSALLSTKRIRLENYGRQHDERRKIVLVEGSFDA